MSSNLPPKFPSTPVFIPAYWNTATSGTLTQDQADARYLKFPTGQGTESIPNLIVSGSTTLGAVSATDFTGGQIIATTYDALPIYTATSTLQVRDGYMSFYNANNPLTKSTLFQITGGKGTIDATGSDFTFVQPPLITTAPANYDSSTKVPTTGWVNTTNGWKYTATNTLSASSTTTFSSCFSTGNFNAYEVYFIFNFTAPTSGYVSCNITLQGLITPTYNSWSQTTNTNATPTITTSFSSTNGYIPLIGSMDSTSNVGIRSQQPKISFWSCITNPLVSVPQIQYSAENYAYSNPGIVGTGKYWGYVQGASGNVSGLTLSFSASGSPVAMTGSLTIVATSRG
jgi:hypothetical protein